MRRKGWSQMDAVNTVDVFWAWCKFVEAIEKHHKDGHLTDRQAVMARASIGAVFAEVVSKIEYNTHLKQHYLPEKDVDFWVERARPGHE